MPRSLRLRACALAASALALVPAGASAAPATGGETAVAGAPVVGNARCATGHNWRCSAGERLRLRGSGLADVRAVAFIGGPGGADDALATPRRSADGVVTLDVPAGARTGRLRVRSSTAVSRTRRSVRIRDERGQAESQLRTDPESARPRSRDAAMTFPIEGRHDMGRSRTNHFGGGRGHQGHDFFAACGTPLVAITTATVQQKAYHSAAGHYVVLTDAGRRSFAYMHLQSAARVSTGDRVRVGQRIGEVGQTGRATGCHLHFEQWTAPGWYVGGRPVDPLPLLLRLEASHAH